MAKSTTMRSIWYRCCSSLFLEDRNLAAPIKGLIARLQIPILKVAMLDKSFFSKGGHPARKLLNEVANASLGWVPSDPNGDVERDPFYFKIETLVARIIDEFVDDVGSIPERARGLCRLCRDGSPTRHIDRAAHQSMPKMAAPNPNWRAPPCSRY